MRRLTKGLLVVAVYAIAADSFARVRPVRPRDQVRSWHVVSVSAVSFVAVEGTELKLETAYRLRDIGLARRAVEPNDGGILVAPVHLPDGAVIRAIALDHCSGKAGPEELRASLAAICRGDSQDEPCWRTEGAATNASSPGECATTLSLVSAPLLPIDNDRGLYFVAMHVSNLCSDGVGCALFGSVRLFFTVTSAPAGLAASFVDVPNGDPRFSAVEAVAADEPSLGCGDSLFCPERIATNAEVAQFLSVLFGLGW